MVQVDVQAVVVRQADRRLALARPQKAALLGGRRGGKDHQLTQYQPARVAHGGSAPPSAPRIGRARRLEPALERLEIGDHGIDVRLGATEQLAGDP